MDDFRVVRFKYGAENSDAVSEYFYFGDVVSSAPASYWDFFDVKAVLESLDGDFGFNLVPASF